MNTLTDINFDNTEIAFASRSKQELKNSHWLFSTMSIDWMVKLGLFFTPIAMRLHLPVKGIIRQTLFKQFVGGETLVQTAKVADKLGQSHVQVILDYGVEGKEGEKNFDHACEEFIRVINYAGSQTNMPFMSVKVTGISRFDLLEKLDAAANDKSGYEGTVHTEVLNEEENKEWQRVVNRMIRIIEAAAQNNIGVLVDAEESWIQDPVDAIVMQMMEKFNQSRAIVFNTFQLYRHDRLQFLKDSFEKARQNNFILGAKLVRGAYMEKERKRAAENNYPSPIQSSKEATDTDYDAAVKFSIENLDRTSLIVASHNEFSNLHATQLLQDKELKLDHPHVHFSQLYGMSDNITFNLARAGCSVSKYLPFGPIKDVIPYLMRRARENSSVKGQTSRELGLIKKELKRRQK